MSGVESGRQPGTSPAPVVVIAGSSGSLPVLQAIMRQLPDDLRGTYIIGRFQRATSGSIAHELLQGETRRELVVAEPGMAIEAGPVYVIPGPGIVVGEKCFERADDTEEGRGPIDALMSGAAKAFGPATIGVLLSGSGHDGAMGLREVAGAGGYAIVQDPSTASQDGGLRTAIATGLVDRVLSPQRIVPELVAYVRHASESGAQRNISERIEEALPMIADVLQRASGNDFRHYKTPMLTRRIARRLRVLRIETVEEYLSQLDANPEEARALVRELLIGVTRFFRDADAFEALKHGALRRLCDEPPADGIRVWVPACATGEEAYSIAMLIRELLDGRPDPPRVRVFGTDIDSGAIERARKGLYPDAITQDVSPERLERFFRRVGDTYGVTKELRGMCVFSSHNLIADPPYSRIDLVSCRNLLIYLGPPLQKKIFSVFHYALRPGGHLFLGEAETADGHADLFEADSVHRSIARRRSTGVTPDTELWTSVATSSAWAHPSPQSPDLALHQIMERIVLDEFAPKSAVVDAAGSVRCTSGAMGDYLAVNAGPYSSDIVQLAKPELRSPLRGALRKSASTRRTVVRDGVLLRSVPRPMELRITVQPMPALGRETQLFLVVFQPQARAEGAASPGGRASDAMERELTILRDDLDRTVRDLGAANHELRASNEELMSLNEELRSSNEELESSKEELQAAVHGLSMAKSDLENLLASTDIAVMFLDDAWCIRSYTQGITDVYNLQPSDVGRPISDITHRADAMPPLPSPESLTGDTPVEHEVRVGERWFVRRALPYRTLLGEVDGIGLTFTDVSDLKRAEFEARAGEERMRVVTDSLPVLIAECDAEQRYRFCNSAYEAWFGLKREQVIGRTVEEVIGSQAHEKVRPLLDRVLGGESVSLEIVLPYAHGGEREVALSYIPDRSRAGAVRGFFALIQDLSERRRREQYQRAEHAVAVILAEGRAFDQTVPAILSALCRTLSADVAGAWMPVDDDGERLRTVRYVCASPAAEAYRRASEGAGFRRGEGLPGRVWDSGEPAWAEPSHDASFTRRREAIEGGLTGALAFPILDGDRTLGVIDIAAREPFDTSPALLHSLQTIGRSVGAFLRRTRVEAAREESEARFRIMADSAPVLVWISGVDGGRTWVNKVWLEFTGRPLAQELERGWGDGVHPEDAERAAAHFRAALAGREAFELEYRLRHHSGQYRWLLDRGVPLHAPDGTFMGYIGACVDIEERRRSQIALEMRLRQQAAVARLGNAALGDTPAQELFDQAADAVTDVLGADLCKVLELMPSGEQMLLRAGVGWREGLVGRALVETGLNSHAGYTLSIDGPVIVTDLRAETRFDKPELLAEHGVISGLSCVIEGPAGRAWGVIGAHTRTERRFTEDDVNFLVSIANVLGGAIQRAHAESEVREREGRFRQLADAMPQLVWATDADGALRYMNAKIRRYLDADERSGPWDWLRLVHPDDAEETAEAHRRALEAEEPFEIEHRIRMADGSFRWHLSRALPVRGEDGRVWRWFGTGTDVHDYRRAEESARLSAARLRLAQQVAGIGTFDWNIRSGVIAWSPELERLYGLSEGSFGGQLDDWAALVHPDDRAAAREKATRALDDGELDAEWRVVWPDGSIHWLAARALVISDADGLPLRMVGVNISITERKRAEERMRSVMDELNHRVKNTLATVDAVARQTLRHSADFKAFSDAFTGRLRSLSAVHSLLTSTDWQGTSIDELLRSELEPIASTTTIRTEGPSVVLFPKPALALHMILHELVTNATKYGPLSTDDGEISVHWSVDAREGDDPLFRLVWQERGGPPVQKPGKRGFGSEMIHLTASFELDGEVDLHFHPEGLLCTLTFPLAGTVGQHDHPDARVPTSALDETMHTGE